MAFRGQYEHTLDAKNRLTIPSKFRAALSAGVVLAKSLDPCATIWTPAGWEGYTERAIGSRDPFSREARQLQRYFHAGSFDGQLDAAGRVMLPPPLIEHARLSREVVVVGGGDAIEIWDRDAWRAHEGELDEKAPDLAQRLAEDARMKA